MGWKTQEQRREYDRKRRALPGEREKYRAYYKEWRSRPENLERDRARIRENQAKDPEGLERRKTKYQERHPWRVKYFAMNANIARRRSGPPLACTIDEFVAWMDRQDLKHCKMCGEDIPHRPNVDHCHQTGALRGVLCARCNMALGVLEDGELKEKARRYLDSQPR